MALSSEEKDMIDRSVNNSIAFGLGIIYTAKEEIEDNGFEWSTDHEAYIFEEHVMKKLFLFSPTKQNNFLYS